MAAKTEPNPEPASRAELQPFSEGDFHALAPTLARDAQYDDRRLEARRKLGSLAKVFVARAEAEGGLKLESRTSMHSPSSFNHMQVKRLWAYVCRGKKEKSRLRSTLGAELGKDLDAAYRNAYLCAAIESDSLEVSLRIHADAWYDGQNLIHRVQREGLDGWKTQLNLLEGFKLELADWKGEWICGKLGRERIEEFLKYYKPGEHALAVVRRFPAPPPLRGEAFAPDMPQRIVEELLRLVPLYRFTAWSEESDHLFGR